jgi:ATP-binding cassette subfamily G (WHITE) protein 2 (SNQ2)
VYFGDLGHNATTLIRFFESNGARPCDPDENPYVIFIDRPALGSCASFPRAEFMLDVIGAGATATSAQDWHDIWKHSEECQKVQTEIDAIHAEAGNRPPVETALHAEFATSWTYQTVELIKRGAESYWRDPTYLMAKLVLNVVGGLFIAFTFYNSKDSQQGTQNKLFVCVHFL